MFPSDYNMSIINAQHGSWDRDVPLGYRVMVLNLGEDGLAQNYSALAEGWLLPNGTVWGKLVKPFLFYCNSTTLGQAFYHPVKAPCPQLGPHLHECC